MNVKTLQANREYWFVHVHGSGSTEYWNGTIFSGYKWEALYYDTREEAEGGMILAAAQNSDLMGRIEISTHLSQVQTVRGPDRVHLRK